MNKATNSINTDDTEKPKDKQDNSNCCKHKLIVRKHR